MLTVDPGAGQPAVFVHRWTATELHRRWADRGQREQLTDAHRRAADYWQWRVRVWPQDRQQDLEDRLEARHHLLAAGQPDAAAALTEAACSQLHAWGAWDREEALIHDTLAHLPASSDRWPAWLTQLGDIAVGRGRPGEAARRYAQGLAIAERLVELDPANTSFQRGLSVSYDRLGDLDEAAGRPGEAARRYAQGLAIAERLVELDPANTSFQRDLSISYERLGDLDRAAGRDADAQQRYSAAVDIRRGLLQREPHRVDLAEELSVTLRLLAEAIGESAQRYEALREIISSLAPFEQASTITPKATAILAWARELTE